jgi:alpha-L-fucosidase
MENNYQPFIDYVHGQIKEIMTGYGKIDVMWYDGWWPFNGDLWQGEKLNAMVKELQPGILVNGRTGVKGDFGTPEGHITASADPWEACMTLNNCWGFHKGDNNWKSAKTVIEMLIKCSQGQGNLLLNVGPEGSGKIPQKTVEILDKAGSWLRNNSDSIFNTKRFDFDPIDSSYGMGDWTHSGPLTANDDGEIFWNFTQWPGSSATLASVEGKVLGCEELSTGKSIEWKQEGDRLILTGMDEEKTCELPEVIKIKVSPGTRIYGCGGCRTPKVEHCRYDPVEPDIAY